MRGTAVASDDEKGVVECRPRARHSPVHVESRGPMRRLTVVQLLPALESGGVERSTLEIAQALVGAGHRAIVVSAGGRLVPRLQAMGAEHVALDIGRKSLLTLRHVRTLRALLVARAGRHRSRAFAPAGLARRAGAAWHAAAARRPRLVTTVHGLNSPSRYSAIMTRGERVICVSRQRARLRAAALPRRDAGKLRVIPRGIDPTVFPRAAHPDATRVPGPLRCIRRSAAKGRCCCCRGAARA